MGVDEIRIDVDGGLEIFPSILEIVRISEQASLLIVGQSVILIYLGDFFQIVLGFLHVLELDQQQSVMIVGVRVVGLYFKGVQKVVAGGFSFTIGGKGNGQFALGFREVTVKRDCLAEVFEGFRPLGLTF